MLKFYFSFVGIIMMHQIVFVKSLELSPVSAGKSATDLADSLDLTSDPCQDFFQFACGNWLNQHQPIPKSKPEWTEYDILDAKLNIIITGILQEPNLVTDAHSVKNSRDMFAACIDMETRNSIGLEPLTDFLNYFGGWPMTLDSWNESHFDWKEATAATTKFYSSAYLINVYNDVDQMNTNRSVIYVDQGSLVLPRSTLVDGDEPRVKDAYIAYAINSAKAIRDYLDSDVRDSFIEKEVKNMLEFERQLAELMTPDEDRRNLTTMYNPMLLSELQTLTSSSSPQAKINWLALMNDIYSLVNITIPSNERVIIVDPDFLKRFVTLLENTPPRVLANYFHWRLVYDLAPDTTQQMIDLQFAFLKVQLGTSQPGVRSNMCASQINNLLGYAVGSKYVEKMFDDDSKTEIELMVANLKRAFKSLVDEAGWMDATTKDIAKDKADAMLAFIGYPSWIKNHTTLDAYYDEYDGIEISRTKHFLNVQNCNLYSNRLDLESLREDTDRTEWNSVPAIANAFYASESNSITFPAGILQSPFFSKGRMAAMNYGAIGSVIGHEITHGFDDQGRQSDKYGNTVQWWTKDTLAQYLKRSKCFIDEYANFTIPNSKSHINGVNTQGENIADNGGIRESFRAYTYYKTKYGPETTPAELKQFSPEQIFFLSFAHIWCGVQTPESLEHDILTDVHSPSRYRIIGTLSNSEDFNRAFNCSANAPMNRVDKCVLW